MAKVLKALETLSRIYPIGQSIQYCKVCSEYYCKCPSLPSTDELKLFTKEQLMEFNRKLKAYIEDRKKRQKKN